MVSQPDINIEHPWIINEIVSKILKHIYVYHLKEKKKQKLTTDYQND